MEPSRQHMRPAAIPFMLCCAVRVLAGDADGSPLNPVEFAAGSQPLGSLQQRHARERGEIPKDIPGDRLSGYLAKPESEGPNPAVVALHGPVATPVVVAAYAELPGRLARCRTPMDFWLVPAHVTQRIFSS